MNLAVNHAVAGRIDEAEREYAQAAAHLEPVALDPTDRGEASLALGTLYLNWGSLAFFHDRPADAAERYAAGAAAVERVLRIAPDRAAVRSQSKNLHNVHAQALGRAGRHADAARAWDRALALTDDSERRDYRLALASALAHAGDHRRALAEADDVASAPGTLSGADLYNLACIASLAAASGPNDLATAHADRAIRWLARARAADAFRDPALLAALDTDQDLVPLRGRRDFQLLRLDAGFPANPFLPRR
jgi:tetratricopeptide (TPR) repeat protein